VRGTSSIFRLTERSYLCCAEHPNSILSHVVFLSTPDLSLPETSELFHCSMLLLDNRLPLDGLQPSLAVSDTYSLSLTFSSYYYSRLFRVIFFSMFIPYIDNGAVMTQYAHRAHASHSDSSIILVEQAQERMY